MDVNYDAPFYKVLARNDTGETGSHQGGIVIPTLIAPYFPQVSIIGQGSTADRLLICDLYDGAEHISTVETRYQIQTWRQERTPEHRLTRNLRPLLERARAADIVVFDRQKGDTERFRLTLVKQGTVLHTEISTERKRAGTVTSAMPATQADFEKASEALIAAVEAPFQPFEKDDSVLTLVQRHVRTELFQYSVRIAYENRCAMCGNGLLTPNGLPEIEAAHIIPRFVGGSNDPRNGLSLCQTHHWAFDRYLWSLTNEFRIVVPANVRSVAADSSLLEFDKREIRLPRERDLIPAVIAIEHHREQMTRRWS